MEPSEVIGKIGVASGLQPEKQCRCYRYVDAEQYPNNGRIKHGIPTPKIFDAANG